MSQFAYMIDTTNAILIGPYGRHESLTPPPTISERHKAQPYREANIVCSLKEKLRSPLIVNGNRCFPRVNQWKAGFS